MWHVSKSGLLTGMVGETAVSFCWLSGQRGLVKCQRALWGLFNKMKHLSGAQRWTIRKKWSPLPSLRRHELIWEALKKKNIKSIKSLLIGMHHVQTSTFRSLIFHSTSDLLSNFSHCVFITLMLRCQLLYESHRGVRPAPPLEAQLLPSIAQVRRFLPSSPQPHC